MKLKEIFELGVQLGIKNDFRGKDGVQKHLAGHKKDYQRLSAEEKEFFDKEILENPYPDTRINNGDPDKEVKKILAGIDMDSGEMLLADRLGDIDLVISHHPLGKGLAELDEQMHIQADILEHFGVPINIAEGLLNPRIGEVERRLHPANHYQAVDTAKLLNIAVMSAHTICDNSVAMFVQNIINKAKPETVGEILELLLTIPEYREARKNGSGPMLFTGSPRNRAGKIIVSEFTGGTEGSKIVYEKLAHAGVGTVLSMHASEEHRKEAEKHHINMVVAGHMSSDSIGMNLFLDELEKRGVEIVAAGGLIRISRNKNLRAKKPAAKAKSSKKRK